MRWIKRYSRSLCVCLYFILLIVCSGCETRQDFSRSPKLSVVTTIFPAFDFAREIAGEYADVSMLLKPGTESHSFEPSPADMIAVENCDIFIYNGGESDAWVETMLENIDSSDCCVIKMMDAVPLIEENKKHEDQEHHHAHGHTAEYDEHIWTSPQNAIDIVSAITKVLMEKDVRNQEDYHSNYLRYQRELAQLDGYFEEIVKSGKHHTVIFGDRFPFQYFVKRYRLEHRAAFPGCSTESEPSAQTIAYLIDKIKEENIPCVFYIEFSNQRLVKVMKEETGAKPLLFHSCHNVSKEEIDAGCTYLSLMQENAERLKEALQSEPDRM